MHQGLRNREMEVDRDELEVDNAHQLLNTPKRVRKSKSLATSAAWVAVTKTLGISDVPEYLRDNSFVHRFYRPELSWKSAFWTIFTWHNESGNIWTHLIGLLLMLSFTIYFATEQPLSIGAECTPAVSTHPKWPLFVYLASDLCTLLFSVLAHTFCCISGRVYKAVWRLDHVGILLGLAGEAFPYVYYLFVCQPRWITFFYLSVTTSLAGFIISLSWTAWFHAPENRLVRPAVMSIMGLWRLASMIHGMVLFISISRPRVAIFLAWGSIGAFGVGAVVMGSRFPECYFPGRFDVYGNSHNVMHVLTFLGMAMTALSGWVLWGWRSSANGSCIPECAAV